MSMFQRVGAWLSFALLATVAVAQTTAGGTPTHRPGPFVQIVRLAQHLNLSADQRTHLHALVQSAQQQVKAIRQDSTLTPEQKREKAQQVVRQTRLDFSALLTPEQQAHLVALAHAHGPLAGLAALHLTDAQKAEARAIFQKQQQDVRTVRQNASLAPDQKKQEIKQIRETSQKQFLALLTPEQLKIWQQMHPHAGEAAGSGVGQ